VKLAKKQGIFFKNDRRLVAKGSKTRWSNGFTRLLEMVTWTLSEKQPDGTATVRTRMG